jgi:DNA-binding response OmpR family regulator
VWILVVEDETLMREAYARMREALGQGLKEENHTVALASDGLERIHAAETCDFDAIPLDVMIPGVDGIDLVWQLRAAGRQTPV